MKKSTKDIKLKKQFKCKKSPDGYHLPQKQDLNTVQACQYCGKVL